MSAYLKKVRAGQSILRVEAAAHPNDRPRDK